KHKKHERAEQQALVERILVPGDGGKRPSDSGLPARPASIRITTETNKSDALQLEYQGLLDALAAGAFPETFEGRPVFYEQKTECKNLNFVQLKTLLHEKIKEKSKNFRIKLNSEQLTACVQEIYKSVSMKYTEFKNHGDQNPRDIRSILAGKHYNDRTLAVFAPQFAERLHIIQNECRDLPVAESDAPRTGVPSVQDDIDAISLDSIPSDIELDPEPEEDSDSTLDHGAGSAELNRAVLADAVKETIQWLLKPDPRPDNAPDALKNLIDVYQLTPQLIQEKRNELTRITVDYFKRRLAMIKAGKYHDCLKHIETYSTQDVPDELHYFICRLNFDIAAEKPSFEETKGEVANTLESIQDWRALPPYYREFLWVVVESFMIRTENRFDIDLTKLTGLSILLPDAIALGLYCYVQMTDVERSQNAATLLQTLAQLVLEEYQHHKPPNTTVRGKFIEDLEATQQIFSNPKNIGSDINRHALRLYYQIYTLMQIEFQAWNFNDSLFAKLILNELHLNMLAHPDYLEWHRNILDNRHYDSPVDHLLYHRITDGHTAQNARQFYWRYFEPNLTALQAQRYWWSDDYTNVAKQRSIKAPTFRAEATVVHIFFTLLTSASGNLIEIIAKNVRYYDDEKKKMCHHDQTLSIIDQVGFIFTLYNTPTTDSSPYGRASKLLRLDEHKDVLLLKAYQALTRLVNYEGETNQKKRDSHDRAYGIVSGYQVALLEDIKTILKTNDDIRDNYIKSLTIMATDSKEPEPMAADVFAFICSVLRKDRPEPWSPVKRTLFSTSSSTKKSNSNNTAPNLLRRRINPESYSLLFNKQWETIALKQDSDRTFAIEQLEKNIRRYYLV
ncbi:MAG: hypothetical protein LRY30_01290, partial [Gammaproteobacteria bacterium]|nr:hypothetical protein [Gammaproteobacteria bacterium]